MRAEARATLVSIAASLALAWAFAASADAASSGPGPRSWPPADGPGQLFVHFGEEHVNDADGATLLPKVVRQSARYRPRLVTMSGDKANDGEAEQLGLWAEVMRIYDRRGVPWLAGVGNHDRKAKPGLPGGVDPTGDFAPYAGYFAGRPYPMGDAPSYPGIGPRGRPAGDPAGAASHYFADAGRVRWVFIDNSCFSIVLCDLLQSPAGQGPAGESQLEFLRRVGSEAGERGRLVFVVMHMPTRDPGDQLYRDPSAVQHTMGKTAAGVLDNTLFERTAAEAGVDGVFVGHIKGQFLYRGQGGVPYFIDGGAGGELYTTGPVGIDHGYWHGYRLIRVRGDSFETDAVPIFVGGGIEIAGSRRIAVGETRTFEAFGRQPVFEDPAKVEALELRDPDPVPRAIGLGAWVGRAAPWLAPMLAVALLFALARLATVEPRRRRVAAVPAIAAIAAVALTGASAAQQSEPTSTAVESLPNPARIWTSSKPAVFRPVGSDSDDRRRNRRTQTADGSFRGACPGRARLSIASGFERRSARIRVASRPGPIARSLRPGALTLPAGERRAVARLRLAQRARVVAKLVREGRKVAMLRRTCSGPGKLTIRWAGRLGKRLAAPGAYRIEVRVLSDRKPIARRFRVHVRRGAS